MGRSQNGLECSMDNVSITGSESSISTSTGKETPRILCALTTAIERLVSRNEMCIDPVSTCRASGLYHSMRRPNISVSKYLRRIYRYTSCSPSCFVLGFVYIDQLVHKHPDFPIVWLNIHRLLLTSIMVATKFLDDLHHNNAFYAKVGGISVLELNNLELDFLFKLKFQLQVTPVTYEGYSTHLERELLLAEQQQIERTFSISFDCERDEESNGTPDTSKVYVKLLNPLLTTYQLWSSKCLGIELKR
ncbi:hypothetical protein GOP47_0022744 [Adiantum capillus-veneris]|uniref:Cyclin n=1 Tax=Adiantum capillus-veneris TaxID=13818 RepID=A0A9D4U6V5_ADICA|nr:hypothetical protein GOP47_0022744 [Adiantum capillus-veneris]